MADLLAQKHVLLVDDDPPTQRLLERALRRSTPGLRVTCAGDGVEALPSLVAGAVDLVITALIMPVIDGLELLRHVANRRIATSVLVMAKSEALDQEQRLRGSTIEVLAEPIELEPLLLRVHALLARLLPRVPGVGLLDLLQLVTLTRRSGGLMLNRGDALGTLYFSDGVLVDACTDQLRGETAAVELLQWQPTTIRFDPLLRMRKAALSASLAELVRAAHECIDQPLTPLPAALSA